MASPAIVIHNVKKIIMVNLTPDQSEILNRVERLGNQLDNIVYCANNYADSPADQQIGLALMYLKEIAPNLLSMIEHYKVNGNLVEFKSKF